MIADRLRRLRAQCLQRLGASLTRRAFIAPFIRADVEYAIKVAEGYLDTLRHLNVDPAGAAFLELGPGINFGPQIILASRGASVTVADRFLSGWNRHYHPRFYRALQGRWPGASGLVDRLLRSDGYPPDVVRCIPWPAERLRELPAESFDCVVSNAVLEHVFDPRAVAGALAHVSRPGGWNVHQIDLRDHKNFRRPLEFLTARAGYARALEAGNAFRGNRWRLSEWIRAFAEAGFEVVEVEVNDTVESTYFDEFLVRLRRADSIYRTWPVDDLRVLGARLYLRR